MFHMGLSGVLARLTAQRRSKSSCGTAAMMKSWSSSKRNYGKIHTFEFTGSCGPWTCVRIDHLAFGRSGSFLFLLVLWFFGAQWSQNVMKYMAYSMRPIKDFNELTHHFVECVYVHVDTLKRNEGSKAKAAAGTPVEARLSFSPLEAASRGGVFEKQQRY